MPTANPFKIKHLAFVQMHRSGFDMWERMTNPKDKYTEFTAATTVYISVWDLKEKARIVASRLRLDGKDPKKYSSRHGKNNDLDDCFSPSIWNGTVGFMSRFWVHKNSEKGPKSYRFGTGIYQRSSEFFLVDDIFDWAHHRIEAKDIRTAHDIIAAIVRGELEL